VQALGAGVCVGAPRTWRGSRGAGGARGVRVGAAAATCGTEAAPGPRPPLLPSAPCRRCCVRTAGTQGPLHAPRAVWAQRRPHHGRWARSGRQALPHHHAAARVRGLQSRQPGACVWVVCGSCVWFAEGGGVKRGGAERCGARPACVLAVCLLPGGRQRAAQRPASRRPAPPPPPPPPPRHAGPARLPRCAAPVGSGGGAQRGVCGATGSAGEEVGVRVPGHLPRLAGVCVLSVCVCVCVCVCVWVVRVGCSCVCRGVLGAWTSTRVCVGGGGVPAAWLPAALACCCGA
jgi:hypothetical protein